MAGSWERLERCVLVEHPSNDGDSFQVLTPTGQEWTFRVYYVDAPETDFRHFNRVVDQAEYFGISPDQAIEVGHMARDFILELMADGFDVETRWHRVYGGSRRYARVLIDGEDLADLLVANGLARIFGMRIHGQAQETLARLRQLEEEARTQGLGAWGMAHTDDRAFLQ